MPQACPIEELNILQVFVRSTHQVDSVQDITPGATAGNSFEGGEMTENQTFEDNLHTASIRALLELGETAMDLKQFGSAMGIFQRRLRYAFWRSSSAVVHRASRSLESNPRHNSVVSDFAYLRPGVR